MAQLITGFPAPSKRSTPVDVLDRAVDELQDAARTFARLDVPSKAALVRSCIPRVLEVAPEWSARGLSAKSVPDDSAEEWLAGPMPTVRQLRLLAQSLDQIAAHGRPVLGVGERLREDGRLELDLFPATRMDKVLYGGVSAYALLQEGMDRDDAVAAQASFYAQHDPDGGVALVLGAGNASSIPATDVLSKMFNDGYVCLLKLNPVNEWLGPCLERALEPLTTAGFLRVVYGGAEVGQYLTSHPGVDAIHLTGSAATHDAMVWGPPGHEQDRRRAANEPLLTVPITSELGNVTPVAVVPYDYKDADLAFQARNLATMVANNASFNCVSAKMLVTARGWRQHDQFLDLLAGFLSGIPTRAAYYPGAIDRYAALTSDREVQTIGTPGPGQLPWTILRDIDPEVPEDPLFRTEPFCSILSETAVGSADPVRFLDAATGFMNDTLWGTLSAQIVLPPQLERDPAVAQALDRAVTKLRYGSVAINQWSALNFGLVSLPWGGHPSASLRDIQSGLGWVHNTYLLGGVEKTVLRSPLRMRPTPVWFADYPNAGRLGADLVALEATPSWSRVARLMRRLL